MDAPSASHATMNISPGVIKGLSVFLMIEGLVWALVIGWMFLVMSGIANPISPLSTSLYFVALLTVPLALMIGPLFILRGPHARLGAIMTAAACMILTALVVHEVSGLFHREPLQAPPSYIFYASLAIIAVLSDLVALVLWRFAFQGSGSAT